QPLLLGQPHLQELPAAAQEGGQLLGGGAGPRPYLGPYLGGEQGQGGGVDGVGLVRAPQRLGEAPGLTRVDDGDGQPGGAQGGDGVVLVATGGLQDDESGGGVHQ